MGKSIVGRRGLLHWPNHLRSGQIPAAPQQHGVLLLRCAAAAACRSCRPSRREQQPTVAPARALESVGRRGAGHRATAPERGSTPAPDCSQSTERDSPCSRHPAPPRPLGWRGAARLQSPVPRALPTEENAGLKQDASGTQRAAPQVRTRPCSRAGPESRARRCTRFCHTFLTLLLLSRPPRDVIPRKFVGFPRILARER